MKSRARQSHLHRTKAPKSRNLAKPDIMAQLKEVWGERLFSSKETTDMRAAELNNEER